MIRLLLIRALTARPKRTVALLLGFGLAVGVMITLLSIGSAVLEQSRDANIVGGGDIVLLPEGVDVEVIKVGGPTGMFYAIENARFVFRQVLSGPRLQEHLAEVPAPVWPGESASPPLAAASPVLANKVVYLRSAGVPSATGPRRALAFGVIPSLDLAVSGPLVDARGVAIEWSDAHADRMWMEPPVDSLYHALDRFHRPPAERPDLDSWAEWLYFNFQDPASGAVAFVSYIVGGDWPRGRGRAAPIVQIAFADAPPRRVAGDWPLDPGGVRMDRCDVRLAPGTRAYFEHGAWRLTFDFTTTDGRARGAIDVEPLRDLEFPPLWIHEGDSLVSGYAVPALRARAHGWLEVAGTRLELDGAPAYHDHNWGTWRDVQWDWGTTATNEYALLYGRIEHVELHPGPASGGAFAFLARARSDGRRGGLVGLFRPEAIVYSWNESPPALPGAPVRVPVALAFEHGAPSGDRLRVSATLAQHLASPPRPGGSQRIFLQMRGAFDVYAVAGRDSLHFTAPGFAETFVASDSHSHRNR